MARRKKKGATLPRVTLLAYDRKALLAFVESVEQLRHLVDDLRIIAESLSRSTASKRAPKKSPTPAAIPVPTANGPSLPGMGGEP